MEHAQSLSQAGSAVLAPGLPAMGQNTAFYGMVGQSQVFRTICETVVKIARSDCTVLIQGESGTGKEIVARAIHLASHRAQMPFVPIDCGAINPNLIESELFGHVRGAFTGAHMSTKGLLRAAEGGTAFLDEIAEIPLSCQAKLLRSLQEMEVMPVGGTQVEKIAARIVAATNKDLKELVDRAEFRNDLYYRLQVVGIEVPPLRERKEDIPLLAENVLSKINARMGAPKRFSPHVLEALSRYDWPGNIRELQNCIERVYALSRTETIEPDDLVLNRPPARRPLAVMGFQLRTLEDIEREAIHNTLQCTGGVKAMAARALGIGVTTLYRKLKQYGIALAPRAPCAAPGHA